MTTTSNQTISDSTWTELADGSSDVIAQIISPGVVEIYVGSSAPGSASGVGHPISRTSKAPYVSFANLGASDKVYGRSHTGNCTIRLTKT